METKYTDEMLEAIAGCAGKDDCGGCDALKICEGKGFVALHAKIAKAYLEERRSRGPCVWGDAPEVERKARAGEVINERIKSLRDGIKSVIGKSCNCRMCAKLREVLCHDEILEKREQYEA